MPCQVFAAFSVFCSWLFLGHFVFSKWTSSLIRFRSGDSLDYCRYSTFLSSKAFVFLLSTFGITVHLYYDSTDKKHLAESLALNNTSYCFYQQSHLQLRWQPYMPICFFSTLFSFHQLGASLSLLHLSVLLKNWTRFTCLFFLKTNSILVFLFLRCTNSLHHVVNPLYILQYGKVFSLNLFRFYWRFREISKMLGWVLEKCFYNNAQHIEDIDIW